MDEGLLLTLLRAQVSLEHSPGLTAVAFWTRVTERGLFEHRSFSWATDRKRLPDEYEVSARVTSEERIEAVVEFDGAGATLRIYVGDGFVHGTIAAGDTHAVNETYDLIRDDFPVSVATEDQVPIAFWSYTNNGPRSITRKIGVASWEAVRENYTSDVSEQLQAMMSGFRPSHGGQLVLWQGIPGTGKTWALRALASEWRDWADFHYITDPDIFFGSRADYMLDVLLDEPEYVVGERNGDGAEQAGRWRVLLLEDTGEILAADAKEKTGQALSRLLNVVDGLIGQGLRILVLVTTNEELKKLHPAVSRAGRCAARIEFAELSGDEAVAWAEERGIVVPHARATIAELYAAAEERGVADEVPIGFVQGRV